MGEQRGDQIQSPEAKPSYGAIVIPSYGMARDVQGRYHPTFFSGIVCRAAYELWKDGIAPQIIIEGARIFPNEPKNDGDLMHALLLKLGVPEEDIIQRKDNSNTYNQLLDAKKTLREKQVTEKVLTVYCDLHEKRIPTLIKNYGINSDLRVAEEVLAEKYPAFAKVWQEIKDNPSYKRTMEGGFESVLVLALKTIDPQGILARFASWSLGKVGVGADVPDIKAKRAVRHLAK